MPGALSEADASGGKRTGGVSEGRRRLSRKRKTGPRLRLGPSSVPSCETILSPVRTVGGGCFSPTGWSIMLRSLRSFLELIRFSHTLFALPFALTSAALAWGKSAAFDWLQLIGILLCMVFARSAAMAFNRLADRRFDADNPRTARRHLPSGELSPTVVWGFTLACSVGFILSTLLFLVRDNPWPLYLSGPVLIFICAYSLTKRLHRSVPLLARNIALSRPRRRLDWNSRPPDLPRGAHSFAAWRGSPVLGVGL